MQTLIVYDDAGFVLFTQQSEPSPREPIGVPFLWVDIPKGKRLKIVDGIGVDTSVTPHQAILEDVPPTEIDEVKAKLQATQEAVDFLLMGGM